VTICAHVRPILPESTVNIIWTFKFIYLGTYFDCVRKYYD